MDPLTILAMIQAGMAIAGPAITDAIAVAETVGTDVAAHKSALQTFQDAFAKLVSVFQGHPLSGQP